MRVVLQRVSEASVTISGEVVGGIGTGLLLLVGFTTTDTDIELVWMADKVVGLRIFPDDAGKMNRSVNEVAGGVLVVSQFTLYGDTRKGRRPRRSWFPPEDPCDRRSRGPRCAGRHRATRRPAGRSRTP